VKYFVTEVVDYDCTDDTRTATVDSLKAARLLAKKWLGKACRRAKWPTQDEPKHQLEDLESYEDPTTNCVRGVTIFRINKTKMGGAL
jgi:hypothetical protein